MVTCTTPPFRAAVRLNSGVMSHIEFLQGVTTATICTYFWVGVEAGILPYEHSKDWAFSEIERLDTPSIEIIEVATANQRNAAVDALRAAAIGADGPVAGRLLLDEILSQFKTGRISAILAVGAAMRVVRSTGMPDSAYYDFDILDDELILCANGEFGTPEALAADLAKTLEQHAGAT